VQRYERESDSSRQAAYGQVARLRSNDESRTCRLGHYQSITRAASVIKNPGPCSVPRREELKESLTEMRHLREQMGTLRDEPHATRVTFEFGAKTYPSTPENHTDCCTRRFHKLAPSVRPGDRGF
jgi:hypothetical protein